MLIGMLPFVAYKHGQTLERIDFSEAQAGKEICDRRISVFKRVMLDYIINNALDITAPAAMKTANESSKTLRGVIVELVEVKKKMDFTKNFKIPNITKYSSFEYCNNIIKIF